MAEEALLGGYECRARGRLGLTVQRAGVAGDVGGLHGGVEVVMDDGEGPGIGIVDAGLLGGEPMLDQLVLDAIVGERAGRVEAERAQIAREHFHRCNAAILYRLDEFGAGRTREILASPKAKTRRARKRVMWDKSVTASVEQGGTRTNK